jgi:hypothetical protein
VQSSRPLDRAATTPSGRAIRLACGVVAALVVLATVAGPVGASGATPVPAPAGQLADGSIGLRLVEVPEASADDPRARLYIVDHLPPGTVIERQIEISNTTAAAAQVHLYSAAATIDDGAFVGSEGATPNELSTWTSVAPGTVEIPAAGVTQATVKVAVPADAAPGEQYGVVWAEVRTAPEGGGVVQANRVGIRLYVSVGPGGAPAANFTIEALTAERTKDGEPQVVATVHNTGGRALDMSGSLELTDGPGGLSAGPFPASLGTTLAIGATEQVTIVLDKQLPDGPWKAHLALRSGLVERTADSSFSFPSPGASVAVAIATPRPWWLIPLAAAVVLLVLLLVIVVVRRRRRRRAPRHQTDDPERHRRGRGAHAAPALGRRGSHAS